MKVDLSHPEHIDFFEIHDSLVDLFRAIPLWAQAPSEKIDARLFPSPVQTKNEELCSDWKAHVEPGLEEHFQSTRSVLVEDLKNIQSQKGSHSIAIPVHHLDAWLNALNQARLALAAHHEFSEKELAKEESVSIDSPRSLALFQIHFYAFLQSVLIERLTEDTSG